MNASEPVDIREKTPSSLDRTFMVAPMMEWTGGKP